MRLLNERQRAFVIAFVEAGGQNYVKAYNDAGYALAGDRGNASRLAHNPKVQAAILEETSNRLHAAAPLALRSIISMAIDTNHKDHFAAAKHILAATGFNSRQSIEISHSGQVDVSFADLRAQIERLRRAGLETLPAPMIDITPEHEPPQDNS
jgi:phage terminase small subunit